MQSSEQSTGFTLGSLIVVVAIDVSVPADGWEAGVLAGLAAARTGCLLSRRSPARTRSPLSDLGRAGAPDLEPCGLAPGLAHEVQALACGRAAPLTSRARPRARVRNDSA